jgi:hypothetical protein
LKAWVAEKYHHKDVPEVITISVENLRGKEAPETTANRIKDIRKDGKPPPVIPKTFTASDKEDLVAVLGQAPDFKLLYRTGASLMSTRLGIAKISPVDPKRLFESTITATGGLVVIGSYI